MTPIIKPPSIIWVKICNLSSLQIGNNWAKEKFQRIKGIEFDSNILGGTIDTMNVLKTLSKTPQPIELIILLFHLIN